ncbi:MAG: MurR/RpiR family transcriptional regulator [Clostridiales bacterium]|nr:MurR/RpiR family transcriptional regulator [Clostridiales bacterium]
MRSALPRLRETRDSMSATERAVADYLLGHQMEAMGLSIHQLAEKTFTSPSTIIRMCQRIGFKGYKDFRQAVTCEVAVRRLDQAQERREITRSDSLEEIVDKITYQNIMSLENTKSLIDIGTLQSCVELLRDARTVLLFGLGASLCAARDLNLRFLRLNKPCVVNDDWHAQLLQAKNASQDDLAIVLSYSGETAEVVECVKALRESRAPIIAITRRVGSPVAELSDHCLYTPDTASTAHSGAMATHISQLNVIDILFTAYANSVQALGPPPKAGAVSALGMA